MLCLFFTASHAEMRIIKENCCIVIYVLTRAKCVAEFLKLFSLFQVFLELCSGQRAYDPNKNENKFLVSILFACFFFF